jgi:hypothetical protein
MRRPITAEAGAVAVVGASAVAESDSMTGPYPVRGVAQSPAFLGIGIT